MTEEAEPANRVWVGVDISKKDFHAFVWGHGEVLRFEQSEQGHFEFIEQLPDGAHVVMESTGGYEKPHVAVLCDHGIAWSVINPRQVRNFARSLGTLCKTDSVDSRIIATFAERMEPAAQTLQSPQKQRLRELCVRQRQLTNMRSQEQNRLDTVAQSLRQSVKEHIRWLTERIGELKASILALIEGDPQMRADSQLLRSVPGVEP